MHEQSASGPAGTSRRARSSGGEQHRHRRRAGHRPSHRQDWRDRFLAERLAGLVDRLYHPLPRLYDATIQAKIITLACQRPADLGWKGQTHWSVVDLATYVGEHPELGLGAPKKSTIGNILQAAKIRLDRL